MYITDHALKRAQERLNIHSKSRLKDEALTAMLYGKRWNNSFIYDGVLFGFNKQLDTLKTVYPVD